MQHLCLWWDFALGAMQHLCLWWDFALGAIVERSRKATAVPMVTFCHISPFATAPSILLKCSMIVSSKWYFESKLSFARLRRVPSSCRLNPDQIQSARTRLKNSLSILLRCSMIIVSKWVAQFCIRFDMIYDCHFEMTAQKFSYRESFSSARTPKILMTKMPPKPHIFVHRFFRSDCPLTAWKYKS